MIKLQGNGIFLSKLEIEHYIKLLEDSNCNIIIRAKPKNFDYLLEITDEYPEQEDNNKKKFNNKFGIFLNNGIIIGDIVLQEIDLDKKTCSIGMGLGKHEYRDEKYAKEAIALIVKYGFDNYDIKQITASAIEIFPFAHKSLRKNGFRNMGIERKAAVFCGGKWSKYNYRLLIDEYRKNNSNTQNSKFN